MTTGVSGDDACEGHLNSINGPTLSEMLQRIDTSFEVRVYIHGTASSAMHLSVHRCPPGQSKLGRGVGRYFKVGWSTQNTCWT